MAILKKLISGLFSFLSGLLGLGKKSGGYYLELDEAKSVSSAPAKAAPAKTETQPESAAPVATKAETPSPAANPLNLPAPTVTRNPEPLTAAPETPAIPFVQFARRRPGANMKSFLDLARQVKTPV